MFLKMRNWITASWWMSDGACDKINNVHELISQITVVAWEMAMPEVAHKWYRISKKIIITSIAQR